MCTANEVCGEYARTLIRVKAKQVVRRSGFSRCEQEDIEQELLVALLSQAQNFDPERSALNTFIACVVDSAISMIVRERSSCKRRPGEGSQVQSLQAMVDAGDGRPAALGAVITLEDSDRKSRKVSRSEAELVELADEVGAAMSRLPDHLQELCRSLMRSSRAETMRRLRLTRRRFDAAINEVRERLEKIDSEKS